MIKYEDLVRYTKDKHINWNTDLFEVLRGFFEHYFNQKPISSNASPKGPYEDMEYFIQVDSGKFNEPEDGEYTSNDLLNLFST